MFSIPQVYHGFHVIVNTKTDIFHKKVISRGAGVLQIDHVFFITLPAPLDKRAKLLYYND